MENLSQPQLSLSKGKLLDMDCVILHILVNFIGTPEF